MSPIPLTGRRAALLLALAAASAAAQEPQPAPTDTLDLFVVAGQSNARGAGGDASRALLPEPGGAYWARIIRPNSGEPTWLDLYPILGTHSLDDSAWPAFGRTYFERTGRPALILQLAKSKTANSPLADDGNGHWSARHDGPGLEGGPSLLPWALGELDAALLATAADTIPPVRIAGAIWIQGENDARAIDAGLLTEADYRAELYATADTLRAALSARAGRAVPLYVVQIGHQVTGDTRGYKLVRRAQRDGGEDGRYTLACRDAYRFPATGMMADNVHWNQAGLNHVGDHVALSAVLDAPPPPPTPTAGEAGPGHVEALPYPNPVRPGGLVRGLEAGAPLVDVLGRLVARADARGRLEAPRVPGVYLAGRARVVVR